MVRKSLRDSVIYRLDLSQDIENDEKNEVSQLCHSLPVDTQKQVNSFLGRVSRVIRFPCTNATYITISSVRYSIVFKAVLMAETPGFQRELLALQCCRRTILPGGFPEIESEVSSRAVTWSAGHGHRQVLSCCTACILNLHVFQQLISLKNAP